MPTSQPPRILFHSPYAALSYHSGMEAVLAQALERRGAEVLFTLCDGLFRECDIFKRGFKQGDSHRPSSACQHCQGQAAKDFAYFNQDFSWLGGWIPRGSYAEARAFADGLPDDGLLTATWRGQPVGDWAQSSAFNQFRLSRVELHDPEVRQALRECIYGAALSWDGLQGVFDEFRPDVVVTFNGRFFPTKVALEMARQRGIRVLCHERGYRKGTFTLRQGGGIHELQHFERVWPTWGDVPLTPAERREAETILLERRFGKNQSWRSFSPPPEDAAGLRAKLSLDDRPVVVCFTSSDDEWLVFPERREGPFPDSLDWIPATVQAARDSPELQWVLRMHPNLVGHGTNRQAVDQALALAEDLPENCRIVQPGDNVSSYTLGDLSAAVVTYGSTMGLEFACQGKPLVTVARGWYGRTGFVLPVEQPADYVPVVRQAVARGPSLRSALGARRYLLHLWAETAAPFPWLMELPMARGELAFDDHQLLDPGRNLYLDHYCAMVLEGAPMQPPPPAEAHGQRSEAEERFVTQAVPALAQAADRPASPLAEVLHQAARFVEQGALGPAAQLLLQTRQIYPGCPELWLLLADALGRLGKAEDARRAATQAVALDKRDPLAWRALATWASRSGGREKLHRVLDLAQTAEMDDPTLRDLARRSGHPLGDAQRAPA